MIPYKYALIYTFIAATSWLPFYLEIQINHIVFNIYHINIVDLFCFVYYLFYSKIIFKVILK